jgi:pilus assembly protein CpaB
LTGLQVILASSHWNDSDSVAAGHADAGSGVGGTLGCSRILAGDGAAHCGRELGHLVAGFVFPGDRVDLVLTQDVKGGGDGDPLKVSETIVRNLRVLATDQRIDSKDEEGKTVVKTFSLVTLEVTPRIAEKIAVAQNLGTLSLSLRSIADQTSEIERAVASGDVKVPEGASPVEERRLLSSWANRPIDTNTTFTTGGDVSRFQRRTVPAKTAPVTAVASAPAASAPVGPVVRVARGNNVTVVPVGAR